MIESLTNLMQTEKKIFTNTLNQQQALITKLQADMDKALKEQNEKFEQVRELEDDMFASLNNKIHLMREVIIQKMDKMMQHTENNLMIVDPLKKTKKSSLRRWKTSYALNA